MRLAWPIIAILILSGLVALAFDGAGRRDDARTDAAPQVVVSVKPLHSLVASVMRGVGEPHLLVPAGASPHHYNLRPSDARVLHDAELVFWIGDALETFLVKPIQTLGDPERAIAAINIRGLHLLRLRGNGEWREDRTHDHGQGHEASGRRIDPHVWLDPDNAGRIVQTAAKALIRADPMHAEIYRANAARTVERIAALDKRIGAQLSGVRDLPYVVFHDAYQYFEHDYALNAAGAITLNPEVPASIGQLRDIRTRIRKQNVRCVFSEPQFKPALVDAAVEDTEVKTGTLDPLGAAVPPGPDAWFKLMRDLADSFERCLSA